MNEDTIYLGDGVYARFDGFGVWLLANDVVYPSDRIYLEPAVLASLNLVWKRWTQSEEDKAAELDREAILRKIHAGPPGSIVSFTKSPEMAEWICWACDAAGEALGFKNDDEESEDD